MYRAVALSLAAFLEFAVTFGVVASAHPPSPVLESRSRTHGQNRRDRVGDRVRSGGGSLVMSAAGGGTAPASGSSPSNL